MADWIKTLQDFMTGALTNAELGRMGAQPGDPQFNLQYPLGSGYDRADEEALCRRRICDFARLQLGKPYHLGVEVPIDSDGADEWDCSELTENAYRRNGLSLPDGSNFQFDFCRPVPVPEAADLGFVWSEAWGRIGHVIMCLGDGTAIEARGKPFSTVRIIPMHDWESHKRWRGWRRHPEFIR